MKLIGLTGGIGMGKSTAAAAFRRAGIPVFDADAAVHRLQAPGGRALRPIEAAFPGTVVNGRLDRAALRARVVRDTPALRRLEAIVHPLVHDLQQRCIARARRAGHRAVVLDIPLLFEGGGNRKMDIVVVVSAPRAIQRARVRARRQMTDGEIDAIIARQVADAVRRRGADLVVQTGLSRWHALRQLRRFIAGLRA